MEADLIEIQELESKKVKGHARGIYRHSSRLVGPSFAMLRIALIKSVCVCACLYVHHASIPPEVAWPCDRGGLSDAKAQ